MTTINMKLALIFIMAVSNIELTLLEPHLFSQALIESLFPKDSGIVRVRTSEETKTGKGVKILDFIGLVTRHGYPAEEHNITTDDGYNLKIHRIPDSPLSNNKRNKKIVFVQHGLFCSSDIWVLRGPGKDLAYLLVDHGYDVWLGNIRGNAYTRSHVKMSPRNNDFWQFSFHELAIIDLPHMIDYILNYTGKKDMYYMGHSMGTSMLYVLLSTRPEYNAKIKLGICLAPIAFWNDLPPVVKQISSNWPMIMEFFNRNKMYEVFPLTSTSVSSTALLCTDKAIISQPLCISLLFIFGGSNPMQVNTTFLPELYSYFPAGTSVLTLTHYAQNINLNDFRDYDYGYPNNSITSKRYKLEKITASLALFYGPNDGLSTKSNVLELYKRLPNVILLEEVPYKLFNHFDFMWAIDAKSILYDRLINVIDEFEAKQPYV